MSTDDAEFLPDPLEISMTAEAHRLAAQWADVPSDVLRSALSAAKAERALISDETRLRLQLQHEREMQRIEQEAATQVERLRHRRHFVNVSVGAVIPSPF
ncbi:hypothetical protein [Streptomyces olivochromogenes]|uniref:hypothetical protein n=1 Tax=Streptomyces olivochromogenes TaxID=1963 RepID=UPI00131D2EFA|nr:hypothetical protein [Streptomyces olivochromogenes]